MKKSLEEKTIDVEKIFKGKVLDVEVHTVTLPMEKLQSVS